MIPRNDSVNGTPLPGPAGQGDPADEQQPRLGFFQQPWVQNVLPFVTSLAVHSVIIVLGVAAAKVLLEHVIPPMHVEQTVIPESQVAENGPPGGTLHSGPADNPFQPVLQDQSQGGKPEGWAPKAGPSVDMRSAGPAGDADPSPLAIGATGVMGSRGGPGTGGEGSGEMALFGTPSNGGGNGLRGPVFGFGGSARQIIFVCDASGSMLNKMATLKSELQKAVDGLKPFQSFNIIFFQDQKCAALDRNTMLPANPDNKRKATQFLDDVTPTGTTDPLPGLTLAFGQHPQLVYLLTDGDFPDNNVVKSKIAELNRDHKTKVNTIAFVNNADTDTEFLKLLEEIANETGGKYRHVAENELQ